MRAEGKEPDEGSALRFFHGLPFSAIWLVAMLLLFATFAIIGVVFGNIVQSSRGIISILIGYLVAAAGHQHLEQKVAHGVLARRIAAAALLSLAIALLSLGDRVWAIFAVSS